jgi:hypothetical protein
MGMAVPLMDSGRIRRELGWTPRHSADEALIELLEGIRESAGVPTPPLEPRRGGLLRWREFAAGVGKR